MSLSTPLSAISDTQSSLNRLTELINKLFITPMPKSREWRWLYDESDDFCQNTKDCRLLVTHIRDRFDLTCTSRSEFDGLVELLQNSYPGARLRLTIKRNGRKVEIKDVAPDVQADVLIECL